jgi:hypothetical protein
MVLMVAGCCGVGAGPSRDQVNEWLSSEIPIGSDAGRVEIFLQGKGFSVDRANNGMFAERVTSRCMFTEDTIFVTCRIDERGRIVDAKVGTFRLYP